MGSPSFAADLLEWMILQKDSLQLDIVQVWTNEPKKSGRKNVLTPTPVSKIADKYSISVEQTSRIEEDHIQKLKKMDLDFILVVAYGAILPEAFFSIPLLGSFNIHFSLLPEFRGASPIQSAILSGKQKTGVTLQSIAKKLDAGDILLQDSFQIENMDTVEILSRSITASKEMLKRFFREPREIYAHREKQNAKLASYCKKIARHQGKITVADGLQGVMRKFRAFQPWPGIFFFVKKERILITEIRPLSKEESRLAFPSVTPAGMLFSSGGKGGKGGKNEKLFLSLIDGIVELVFVVRAGKRATTGSEFVRGYKEIPVFIDDI